MRNRRSVQALLLASIFSTGLTLINFSLILPKVYDPFQIRQILDNKAIFDSRSNGSGHLECDENMTQHHRKSRVFGREGFKHENSPLTSLKMFDGGENEWREIQSVEWMLTREPRNTSRNIWAKLTTSAVGIARKPSTKAQPNI